MQCGVHANPISNPRGTCSSWVFLVRLSAGCTCRGSPRPWCRVVDLLFLRVSRPYRRRRFLVSYIQGRLQHDPSLHLYNAMGQQVSKDIRSRLEHCTLEELLTEDKVIPFTSLGELRRLTACSLLRSFNSISQGCPRDYTTSLQD
jgi:hypothetical protein